MRSFRKLQFVLALCAVASLLFGGETVVFDAISLVMALVAGFLGIQTVKQISQVRLSAVLALSLLLGYGLGSFSSVVGIWTLSSQSVAGYFGYDAANLADAQALVCLVVAAILAVPRFESGIFRARDIQAPVGRGDLVFISIMASVVFFAFATGGLGFQGTRSSDTGHVDVAGVLASMLNPPLVAYSFYCYRRADNRYGKYFLALTILLGLLLVPQGRRIFLYSAVLAVFAYALAGGGFRFVRIRTMAMIAAGIALSVLASNYFYLMRVSSYDEVAGQYSTWDLAEKGADLMANPEMRQTLLAAESQNVSERTFILGYLGELLGKTRKIPPLYGEVVEFAMDISVPSVLAGDKSSLIAIGYEEAIANPHFGLPDIDSPNSIITSGLSDFGVVGAFAYPLLVLLLYGVAAKVIARFFAPPIVLITAFSLIYSLLQVEDQLSSHFLEIRDLVLVVLIMHVAYKISRIRVRL